jgi:hypothetical protein
MQQPTVVWDALTRIVADLEATDKKPQGAVVKPLVQVDLGHKLVESDYGFRNFKDLVLAAETAGYVRVIQRPGTDFILRSVNTEFAVLAEVVGHIIDRGGVALGAHTKVLLRDALGGSFDESALGYKSFKDFAAAAEESGYVTVEYDPLRPDIRLSRNSAVRVLGTRKVKARAVSAPNAKPTPESDAPTLEQAFSALSKIAREAATAGRVIDAGTAKQLLSREIDDFTERAYRFGRFQEFLEAAEEAGYVSLHSRAGHGKSVLDVLPPDHAGVRFSDIKFGYTSAGAESVRSPDLLGPGFYDFKGVVRAILEGSEYVVLGHKGSGKSAIGEHLVQKTASDPLLFVDFIDLKDFPYGTLSKLADDDSSPQLLRLSWRWLILLRVFQYLLTDGAANPQDESDALRLAKQLEKFGLLPSQNLSDLSLKSVNMAAKGGLPTILEASVTAEHESRQVQLTDAIGRVQSIVMNFRTDSRHIHVIDGLDELLSPDSSAYGSLSALLGEVESLNDAFYRANSAAKIVLLCRTDLYERLTSPNKNKIRQDFSVSMRWSTKWKSDGGDELGGLIRQRARLSGYLGDDPIRDLLPIKSSHDGSRTDMWPFLLSQTRQTPRDLIALLTTIQQHASGSNVTTSHIGEAIKAYSFNYFLPELKDELAGYLDGEQIDQTFGLLGALRLRTFKADQVSSLASKRSLPIRVLDALQILFDCSAIGHDMSRNAGEARHEFRYMNPNLAINPDLPLIMHRGAWPALKIES